MKSMLIGAFVCLQLSALILAAPAAEQQTLPKCVEQTLTITGDNKIHELYIDGILVTPANADDWTKSGTAHVPKSAKVIAVKVEDLHQVAGILASGSNFVSDGSWKCTNTYYTGWHTTSFSAAGWPDATVIGQHGVSPWGNIAGISANAYWIWTSNHVYGPTSDKVVYCRKEIECVNTDCLDQTLTITGDNKIHGLYIDGTSVTVANADDWTHAGSVNIPGSAKVIAVKVEDLHEVAGILASGSSFVSDGSWKCTNTYYPGWHTTSFSAAGWPYATVIGQHGVSPWGNIAGIKPEAYWIWTSKHVYGSNSDKIVYCRKEIECDGNNNVCSGTGSACITSCHTSSGIRPDGDYQSCKGCDVYISCSNGNLYDNRPCAASGLPDPLQWDDKLKRCEWSSTTCSKNCGVDPPPVLDCSGGTGPQCITSCAFKQDGDYQSCNGCDVYASCSNGYLIDRRPCALNHDGSRLKWDDNLKRCEYKSSTCNCP